MKSNKKSLCTSCKLKPALCGNTLCASCYSRKQQYDLTGLQDSVATLGDHHKGRMCLRSIKALLTAGHLQEMDSENLEAAMNLLKMGTSDYRGTVLELLKNIPA